METRLTDWNEPLPPYVGGVISVTRPLPPVATRHADGCMGGDCRGIDVGSNRACACHCHTGVR